MGDGSEDVMSIAFWKSLPQKSNATSAACCGLLEYFDSAPE